MFNTTRKIRRMSLGAVRLLCGRARLNARGSIMAETIIAISILGIVGTAVAASLSTARASGTTVEEAAIAENIARNHLESVFATAYQTPPATYSALSGLDPGYASTAVAQEHVAGDTRIEKIIVTVTRDGSQILVIETLRTQE